MGTKYNCRPKHYTFNEIMRQVFNVKQSFPNATYDIVGSKHMVNTYLYLRPTGHSVNYEIRLSAYVGKRFVKIHVISPHIGRTYNGKKIQHMFRDASLCLFYPKYGEWHYTDKWTETIIPWTSLWLFYYEIWIVTGEWLGGGIHGASEKQQKDVDDKNERKDWK